MLTIFLAGLRPHTDCPALQNPTEDRASGPQIDQGPDGRSPGKLAKLRHCGDWVEFSLRGGVLVATDHTGNVYTWGAGVTAGESWVPTIAWTGSRAGVRLAPPLLDLDNAAA